VGTFIQSLFLFILAITAAPHFGHAVLQKQQCATLVGLIAPRHIGSKNPLETQTRAIEVLSLLASSEDVPTARAAREVIKHIATSQLFLIEGENLKGFMRELELDAALFAEQQKSSGLFEKLKTADLFFPRLGLALLTFSGMYLIDAVPDDQHLLRIGIGVAAIAGSIYQMFSAALAPTPAERAHKRSQETRPEHSQVLHWLKAFKARGAQHFSEDPYQFFFSPASSGDSESPRLLIVTTRVT